MEDNELVNIDDNFDDVIQLTEYEGDGIIKPNGNNSIQSISQYDPVDVQEIDLVCQKQARNLVDKIKGFIIKYSPTDLDEDVQEYITAAAELEISGLADMLQLIQMNKLMISNIVNRINDTLGEDFAAINSYNQLVNMHMKLMKDVQNRYKSIPETLKRMKTDIETDQLLPSNGDSVEEKISENYGVSQFNNSRELINSLSESDIDEDSDLNEDDI